MDTKKKLFANDGDAGEFLWLRLPDISGVVILV